jgi:hypothetical protein
MSSDIMKNALAVLCILAIVLNVYIGIFYEEAKEEWTGGTNIDDDIIDYSEFSVTVPEIKVGDIAQYDYTIFAEMFWENKTSGNWTKYTLNANGQLVNRVSDIIEKKDGFNMKHQTVDVREETAATLSITIDGSDSEKFVIHGSIDGTRDEYTELAERKVIQVATDGNVELDKIRQVPIPVSYDGRMRNFPDPNLEREQSLDEQIYLGNKTLKLEDNGNILTIPEGEFDEELLTQLYNWSVIRGEKVAGYNTLVINITTGFFWGWMPWMPFVKRVWIANEVSVPVKVFIRTNSSAENEEGSFYTIIEHTRTLQTEGFSPGTKIVPWNPSGNANFHQKHPMGEFRDYNYLPGSGKYYDRGSFDHKPEDAEQFALENSAGLNQYLNKYDKNGRVIVTTAAYNVVKDTIADLDPTGKAGSYNWNLSFRYNPTRDEIIDAWQNNDWPEWCYYVNLTRNLTKETGINKYSEEIKIINEYSRSYTAPYNKNDFDDRLLTIDSSEEIFKLDPEIEDQIFNPISGELDFEDMSYALVMGDITAANMPGIDLLETITGITLPTSKFSWAVQKGSVYLSGNTFSAAVDVETGQLLYVMEISGTELYRLFG